MKALVVVTLLLALTGCAAYRPIVDTQYVDMNKYEQDLKQCQAYAQEVHPEGHAVAGAILGAILGAVVGASFGNGQIAASTAAYGGATGALYGGAEGALSQKTIIQRCLAGRGYNVLG